MADSSVTKVDGEKSPVGRMGQRYLATGVRVSMRLWLDEEPGEKEPVRRDYETVGYVLKGRAELTLEGQTVRLEAHREPVRRGAPEGEGGRWLQNRSTVIR